VTSASLHCRRRGRHGVGRREGVPDLLGEDRTHRSDLREIANTFGCEPRAGIARRDDGPRWRHGWRVGNSLIQRYRALFNERRARVGGGSHCGVEGSGLGVWKASMGRVDGGGDVWREREVRVSCNPGKTRPKHKNR